MSTRNIKTKLLFGLTTLPLLAACDGAQNGGFLETELNAVAAEVSTLSGIQRGGYLGRMSERVMLNGNLEVLGSLHRSALGSDRFNSYLLFLSFLTDDGVRP